jgi:hypothetical protein
MARERISQPNAKHSERTEAALIKAAAWPPKRNLDEMNI